ncbi:MAG: DUF3450 family protein [Pseudomonadota bacterium]
MLKIVSIFILVVFNLALASTEQEKKIKLENEELKLKIITEQKLYDKELAEFKDFRINRQKRIEDQENENNKIKNEIDILKNKISGLKAKKSSTIDQAQNKTQYLKAFSDMLLENLLNLKTIINQSMPYHLKTRTASIESLISDIKASRISENEAFSRLKKILDTEKRYQTDSEVYTSDILQENGEALNVKILRIGSVFMAYYSMENKTAAILDKKTEGPISNWAWNNNLSFDQKRQIKQAIQILEGKRKPSLIMLPLNLDNIEVTQ